MNKLEVGTFTGTTKMALPALAWVQIKPHPVEVDGHLETLEFSESAGHALDLLNLAVESLAHRVGHWMLVVGQDIVNVSVCGVRSCNMTAEGHSLG
ncbi:MAG TPA: hypothetical protein PKK23_21195 [Nitrospirales bacterium]|nr:hypothetical protein [Nitrospirales bacterium]